MIGSGFDVVIISSRGARDIARLVGIPGVYVIGSLGWETLDNQGISHIHPRFQPYGQQITGILREVRERLLTEQLHASTSLQDAPNNEFFTPEGGKVILQRKGYNDEYPEGINATWVLNLVDPNARKTYRTFLTNYYNQAFEKYAPKTQQTERERLKKMCDLVERLGQTPEGLSTLDVEIRPTSQNSKARAMIQLMRHADDPKRGTHFRGMPFHNFWVYSGDSFIQDGPPMRAGHAAMVLTHGKRGVLGIWSKPPYEQQRLLRGVNVVVDGVSGNAELMLEIADLMGRYPGSSLKQH